MQVVKLIPATYEDIGAISKLAAITWNQHYPSIITQAQIDYMLAKMYSAESLGSQMQKGHRFFFIENSETNVGFISVTQETGDEWFLNKFYIDQPIAARGIGSIAFQLLKEVTGARKMTLTVNRQNFKSINFYFKQGFRIERVADFDIGEGYVMNDFVMVWQAQ